MSSISVGNSQTSTPVGAQTSITLTKPTSLAVGDYMIVAISAFLGGGGGAASVTTPGGWSTILSQNPGSTNLQTFWKKADAADVSATNFVFTVTSSFVVGGITRLSAPDDTVPVIASHGTTGATTTPGDAGIAAGVQPLLMIVVGSVGNATSRSVSGYQVANTNPSWTEAYDIGLGASETGLAMATAPYTLATATGAAQATLSGAVFDNAFQIIAFQPQIHRISSPFSMVAALMAPIVAVKFLVPSALSLAGSLIAPTIVIVAGKITNAAKHAASWLNTPKS